MAQAKKKDAKLGGSKKSPLEARGGRTNTLAVRAPVQDGGGKKDGQRIRNNEILCAGEKGVGRQKKPS